MEKNELITLVDEILRSVPPGNKQRCLILSLLGHGIKEPVVTSCDFNAGPADTIIEIVDTVHPERNGLYLKKRGYQSSPTLEFILRTLTGTPLKTEKQAPDSCKATMPAAEKAASRPVSANAQPTCDFAQAFKY